MADYKGVISDLRMKRDALRGELTRLDGVISELERMNGGASTQQQLFAGGSTQRFKGQTLKRSIEVVLDEAQHEFLAVNQIIERLERGGFESKAQRLYPSVYSTLFRMSEEDGPAIKTKDGKWGLRKWHQNQA